MARKPTVRWLFAAGVLLLGIPLVGQARMEISSSDAGHEKMHLGYPQDWSSRHLLMPGMQADDVLAAGEHDPHYVYNMVMRQVAMENLRRRPPRHKRHIRIDWAVSLENGYVPQNQFPAKYRFDVNAENCNSDYVVLGLTVTSGTQANIVGINNLYTSANPPCNSGSPWVAFAFKAVTHGGQIKTSPVLSTDGTKVAFVESTNSASYFHVLVLPNPIPAPPSQAGTVLSPLTPIPCTKPVTALCMTDLRVENVASNSNSSPWVDYNTDTAYAGADNGLLYKITPVFGGGAPALVNDPSNWPVTVSTNARNTVLTAPVVDDSSGLIFLGDGEGYLYSVKLANPGKTYAAQQTIGWAYDGSGDGSGGAGVGIVDPPIAVTDPANPTTDQVFAFTGCSYVLGIGGAISQLPANFTSGVPTTSNTVDMGSATGAGDCTGNNLHSGAFDNAFWLNGSTSGHMIACGFVNNGGAPSNPQMYFFPFASNVITSTGSSHFVVNNNKGEECSPLTEFYNGTSDMMFFGVGSSSKASYLESSTITSSLTTPNCTSPPTSSCVTAPNALGGTSGIVIDNEVSNGGTNLYFSTLAAGSVNGQKCNVSGGTANPYCAVKLTQSALQ
ncbi:MAG TPA: hypothetical protein VJP02_31585 [Candidatus Sulfotelmatobacter sp.]|nr:hypothetical protein [Candidatus Sulfotelmatobacter sp.]